MLQVELSRHFKSNQLFDFHLTRCDKIANYVMSRI